MFPCSARRTRQHHIIHLLIHTFSNHSPPPFPAHSRHVSEFRILFVGLIGQAEFVVLWRLDLLTAGVVPPSVLMRQHKPKGGEGNRRDAEADDRAEETALPQMSVTRATHG